MIADPSLQPLLYLASMCRREDVAGEFMAVGGSLSHLGEPSNRANMAYLSLSNTVWCFPFLWNILRNCLNHWPTLKLFLCACACRHVCMVHTCRKKDNFGESVFLPPRGPRRPVELRASVRLGGRCVDQLSHFVGLLGNVLGENSYAISPPKSGTKGKELASVHLRRLQVLKTR